MRDLLAAVRILHRKIEGRFVDALSVNAPRLGRICECFLQLHELGKIIIVERVGFSKIAAGIKLVIPDLPRGRAFVEEQNYRLHARALKRPAGAVKDRMQGATLQKLFAQFHGGVVGVRQESILYDHAAASSGLELGHEMLEKQERRLAGANAKILLHFRAFLTTKRWISHHHLEAVFLLNVENAFGESIGMGDVRRLNAG